MLKDHITESIELQKMLLESSNLIEIYRKSVETIIRAFQGGNKILVAGNGGSAADAQHFAAEFVGKFKMIRKGYPAISLTVNASVLTAWSNRGFFASEDVMRSNNDLIPKEAARTKQPKNQHEERQEENGGEREGRQAVAFGFTKKNETEVG